MKTIRFFAAFAILCSLAITSCTKDDQCKTKGDADMVCYEIYAPVCGCDGETYANDCYADRAGVLHYTQGVCQ